MQSAFQPVRNYNNFKFYWGYKECNPHNFCDNSLCSNSSENAKPKKRRWSLEQKVYAVHTAQSKGVSAAITYLLQTNYAEYQGLSTSTLQYWIRQSKGRKRRYYE
ncbi:HTH psq-type domain-containing protein [Entamoeba marina]